MDLLQKTQISLTVLLTGLVVVFVMLIALTLIIKGYGSEVNAISAKFKAKRDGQASGKAAREQESPLEAEQDLPDGTAEEGIPEGVVAAIAAAVYCTMPGGRIKSMRRAPNQNSAGRSAWNMAGRLNNTRPL